MKSIWVISLSVMAVSLCRSVAAADDGVAARVNGAAIREVDLSQLADKIAASEGASAEDARSAALESLIGVELLNQEASRQQIEATPAEIDQQLNEMKSHFSTADAFEQALASLHATEADMRREIGRTLVAQKLLERKVSVQLSPTAADQFYKEHADKFQHAEEVHARHILFRTGEDTSAEEAKRHAEAALKRVKAGEKFEELAKTLSQDTGSAKDGGDLGFFSRDDVVKPFAEAAFALKTGQVSGVVQTDFGFHIIKVIEKRPAGVTPLAEVRAQIENYLRDEERDRQAHAYVDELRKNAKIEIVSTPGADGTQRIEPTAGAAAGVGAP